VHCKSLNCLKSFRVTGKKKKGHEQEKRKNWRRVKESKRGEGKIRFRFFNKSSPIINASSKRSGVYIT